MPYKVQVDSGEHHDWEDIEGSETDNLDAAKYQADELQNEGTAFGLVYMVRDIEKDSAVYVPRDGDLNRLHDEDTGDGRTSDDA